MTETLDSSSTIAIDWPAHRRLMMVFLGYIPFLLVALTAAAGVIAARRWGPAWGAGSGILTLYLLPPLAYRVATLAYAPECGRHPVTSPAFLRWWLSAQWQVIFNRLPMLEELLRIVPGLYSSWLRLWGAQIGALVYWSPGVTVLDRPFACVGSRVVFGAGVRLNPHVIVSGKRHEAQLWLAPVTLGDDSLVGGYCVVTAGSTISAGTAVPAGKYFRPYTCWEGNQPVESRSEGIPTEG